MYKGYLYYQHHCAHIRNVYNIMCEFLDNMLWLSRLSDSRNIQLLNSKMPMRYIESGVTKLSKFRSKVNMGLRTTFMILEC